MSEAKESPDKTQLDPFDALIAGLKIHQERQRSTGQKTHTSPQVDKYIEEKAKEVKKK